jgi:hypothetical protein
MKKILLPLVFFTGFVIKSNSQASSKAKKSFAENKLAEIINNAVERKIIELQNEYFDKIDSEKEFLNEQLR